MGGCRDRPQNRPGILTDVRKNEDHQMSEFKIDIEAITPLHHAGLVRVDVTIKESHEEFDNRLKVSVFPSSRKDSTIAAIEASAIRATRDFLSRTLNHLDA